MERNCDEEGLNSAQTRRTMINGEVRTQCWAKERTTTNLDIRKCFRRQRLTFNTRRPHLTGSWVPTGGEPYGRRQAFQFPALKGEINVMLETWEKLQLIFPLSLFFFICSRWTRFTCQLLKRNTHARFHNLLRSSGTKDLARQSAHLPFDPSHFVDSFLLFCLILPFVRHSRRDNRLLII